MESKRNRIPEIAIAIKTAVKEAERASAELVADSARDRVPYDENEPHHIRDAIHLQEDEEGVYVVAGDKDVFYAHMVEHGTTHSAPHPFLVPALEEHRAEIIATVTEAIRKATK